MTKETLSDKIWETTQHKYIPIDDIKESIKRLTPQLFHDIYEEEANKVGWETQKKCKVDFDDLPETNQETMINTIRRIKNKIFGDKLT